MQKKTNTKQIIEIWMKACFEKLMREPKSEVRTKNVARSAGKPRTERDTPK